VVVTTLDQASEHVGRVCAAFRANSLLARTGKCLIITGTLAGRAAIAKCLFDPDPYWRARFVAEIGWYRVFEQHVPPVAVPRLLFADETQFVSILELLDGAPLSRARYVSQPQPPDRIAALLAELARLHGWSRPHPPAWSEIAAGYREKFQRYASRGLLSADDCSNLDILLGRARSAPEFNHGDMLLSNCLALGSQLALIDWEFAGYYLPGYDLALLWTLLQADDHARHRIVEAVQQRGAAAQSAFVVNQMRVLAREIKIHQKEGRGTDDAARLRWLEADRDAVRVFIQTHLAC
jgi:Phosphotransferase enzyme family